MQDPLVEEAINETRTYWGAENDTAQNVLDTLMEILEVHGYVFADTVGME